MTDDTQYRIVIEAVVEADDQAEADEAARQLTTHVFEHSLVIEVDGWVEGVVAPPVQKRATYEPHRPPEPTKNPA
jgi:hypothetical protein